MPEAFVVLVVGMRSCRFGGSWLMRGGGGGAASAKCALIEAVQSCGGECRASSTVHDGDVWQAQ